MGLVECPNHHHLYSSERYFVEDLSSVGAMEVTVDYTPAEAEIIRTEYKIKCNTDDPYFVSPNFQPNRHSSYNKSGRTSNPPRVRDRSHSRMANRNSGISAISDVPATPIYTFILTFQSNDLTIVDYHFMTDTL